MKYYEWLGEPQAVEIIFPSRQYNGFYMVEGTRVMGWTDYMIAVYLEAVAPEFQFGMAVNSWPVFSPGMQSLLKKRVPRLIQFLPFRFQRPDGTGQVTGYCIGQILKRVDCFDRARTKVMDDWEPVNRSGDFSTYWPTDVVLSRSKIGTARLFRVQGNCISIVIREDLKKAIEDAGFRGQRFDEIECSG